MILLNGRLQLFQAALAVLLSRTDFFMPGKDLCHPKILALLQKVRDHALADGSGIQITIREQGCFLHLKTIPLFHFKSIPLYRRTYCFELGHQKASGRASVKVPEGILQDLTLTAGWQRLPWPDAKL